MIWRIVLSAVLFGACVAAVAGQGAGEAAIIAAFFAICGLIALADVIHIIIIEHKRHGKGI